MSERDASLEAAALMIRLAKSVDPTGDNAVAGRILEAAAGCGESGKSGQVLS